MELSDQLHALLLGEEVFAKNTAWLNPVPSMNVASRLSIHKAIPADSKGTALAEIAKRTGTPEDIIRRVLRTAIANYAFAEPEPDVFCHTASSRALIENEKLDGCLRFCARELIPTQFWVRGLALPTCT